MEASKRMTTLGVLRVVAKDAGVALFVLLCIEIVIRIVIPQPLHRLLDDVYELKDGDYRFRAGVSTICNNGYGDHEFSINRWRARDKEYGPKQTGEWRILAMGNSYSQNVALEVDDIWANVLESRLGEAYPDRPFTVINAGQAAWGLWKYHDYLEEMLPVINPDLVVMLFGTTHDMQTRSERRTPRPMTLIRGLPTPRDASALNRLKFAAWYSNEMLESWSHAYVAFRRVTYYPGLWLGVTKVPRIHPICSDANTERFVEPTIEVLRKIKTLCEQRGIELVVVNVPHEEESIPAAAKLKVQLERPDVSRVDFGRPTRLLEQIATQTPVLMYDPSPDLASAPGMTYFLLFRHWNELGNRIVATGLQRFLEQNGLLGLQGQRAVEPHRGDSVGATSP